MSDPTPAEPVKLPPVDFSQMAVTTIHSVQSFAHGDPERLVAMMEAQAWATLAIAQAINNQYPTVVDQAITFPWVCPEGHRFAEPVTWHFSDETTAAVCPFCATPQIQKERPHA